QPERHHPGAAAWLAERGYDSTVDYLLAACQLVLDETGLLPRTDVGVLGVDDLRAVRAVAVSQGLVLRGLDRDLARQLGMVDAAGVLRIPFGVRLLIGAGESRDDRVQILRRVADSHHRHGHLQEVA